MFNFLKNIFRREQTFGGVPRSPRWPKLRKEFLKDKSCAVCGRKDNLSLHHITPYHIRPNLELTLSNLVPLCERPKVLNCHLIFGHFGNFRDRYNPDIIKDAELWNRRLTQKVANNAQ